MADDNAQNVVPPDPNKDKKEKILEFLEQGTIKSDVGFLVGVDRSTVWRWEQEDATFATNIEASILKYKQKLINIVNVRSVDDGNLALKILARRWSDDFGEKQKIEIESPEDKIAKVNEFIDEHFDEKGLKDEQVPSQGQDVVQEPAGEPVSPDTGTE